MELLGAYSCPWRPESWKVTIGEVLDSRAFERGSVRSRREGARGGQVVDIKRRRLPPLLQIGPFVPVLEPGFGRRDKSPGGRTGTKCPSR